MTKLSQKPKLLYLNRSSITVHKSAHRAYFFQRNTKKQYLAELIPESTYTCTEFINPVVVIKNSKNKYDAIANWHVLDYPSNQKILALQINEELSDENIELIAWSNVFIHQVQSWDRTSNLSHMVDLLNSCPQELVLKFKSRVNEIKKSRISSNRSIVTSISDETLEVLKNQCRNNSSISQTNQVQPTIFDMLVNNIEDE